MVPFSYDLLDEEQNRRQQEEAQGQGAPAMTGGGETFGESAPSSPQQSGAERGTNKQGSGFVGLDKYMSANQGNNFGGQFTGKVQGGVNQAKQTLADSSQQFTDASNQGATKWNDVQGTVKGLVDNAGANTSADDAARYKSFANAQYQGPESFGGSAFGTKAQGAVQKSAQEANALQSEGGRFALLDQFYGRPKYSTGEKSLDNLLVQNTPGVAARSNSIGNQAKQLTTEAGQTTQNLNNLATANKAATQETGKQAKSYLDSANTTFQNNLAAQLASRTQQNTSQYGNILNNLKSNALTDEDLSALNLRGDENIYNLDPSQYLQKGQDPTLYNTASAEDYARAKALASLGGQDDSSILSSAYANQAGTAGSPYSFDSARFNNDLVATNSAFNQAGQDFEKSIAPYIGVGPGGLTGDPQKDAEFLQANSNLLRHPNAWKALTDYLSAQQVYKPDRTLAGDGSHSAQGGSKKRSIR